MGGGETRLERAMQVWLRFRTGAAGDAAAMLAAHPDLADLLRAMLEDESAASPDTRVGRTLGDFRILREVGRGGMGVVYDARQLSLDRRVALKVLATGVNTNPAALARFRREALTLARLDHPHVVGVFDVGETDGRHWLAMEFVEGEPLDRRLDFLRQNGHRGDSLRRLVEVVADVADALHHVHGAGVVHRDVKPSNILLREDGTPVLTDFGLARDASAPSVTAVGAVAGTPHYMSPEQVAERGRDLDARSDVFSLGATLYECVTLVRPFEGPTIERILHRILVRDPVDPRRRVRNLAVDLSAIIMRALEKDPARRYPTARAFAEDLRAFLCLRPVQARPVSGVTRLRRWARREPLQAALALSVGVAILLGGGFLWRLPDIRAGAAAQRERDYDDAIAAGMLARAGKARKEALAQFDSAIALAPDRAEGHIGRCLTVRDFDGPERALVDLESLAAGADPELRRLRVTLLRAAGRDEEAQAVARGLPPPASPIAHWLAAGDQVRSEDPAVRVRALHAASLAVRIAPSPRLLFHVQWAACVITAGDLAQRQEAADALLTLWPEHPVALHYAAVCLLPIDADAAVAHLQRALAHGLDDRYGHYNLASALSRCGRKAEAVAPLRAACAANPGHAEFRQQLVDLLHDLGDTATARAECERWVQEAPADVVARRKLAQQLSFADEHARAIELAQSVCAARPDDGDIQYDLAVILDTAGEVRAARDQLARVLALRPTDARAHNRLLGVLKDLEDPAAMLVEMERWAQALATDADAWAMFARGVLTVQRTDLYAQAARAAERADYLARGENAEYRALHADALERSGDAAGAASLRARSPR